MIDLSLARISRLVTHPQGWKAIHIAGTNGKGSVAAYLSALFHHSGYRVGRFTSPHLIDRWDCITLNQKPVARDVFLDVEQRVKARDVKRLTGEISNDEGAGAAPATEFELLTATAFDIFNDPQENIQVGIIECGLGGRRDATNILKPDDVLVSVITKIGLDHQVFLGSNVEDIAREKAGIIKRDVPLLVDGSNTREVKAVIRDEAQRKGAGYLESDHLSLQSSEDQRVIDRLPRHQKDNLAVALNSFRVAQRKLRPSTEPNPTVGSSTTEISTINLTQILTEVQVEWQGRLQWLSLSSLFASNGRNSKVLLDGAHNLQSAEVLRDYVAEHLRTNTEKESVTWILAFSANKDISGILSTLLQKGDAVIATGFGPVDGMPWVKCAKAEDIAKAAAGLVGGDGNGGGNVCVRTDLMEAIEMAVELAGTDVEKEGRIVISGSLYLVSDVLRLLQKNRG